MSNPIQFDESNTVQNFIINLLTVIGWKFIPSNLFTRQITEPIEETKIKEALIRLNNEIRQKPERADEVIYKLRAILLSVQTDGLVRANEEFMAWLKNERSMPFGKNNQHVPVKLIDFEEITNNEFIVTIEYSFQQKTQKRLDIVLLINGFPVIIGECKSPVRNAVSWFDAAIQIREDYELNIPAVFASNVFVFGTEGKTFRFASIKTPFDLWAPWNPYDEKVLPNLKEIEYAVKQLFQPSVVLDILNNFTLFATDRQNRKIKIICRHQQYDGANKIVERVVAGRPKKGLIWHFQGSGKSLLMVFAAQKLRLHPKLRSPTVMIVVDRIDLDTQITATFNAADIPNVITTESRDELRKLLLQDTRKIIITTIYKFGEYDDILNERENIIVMVDEAHRTQEGDFGIKMRSALPNAFFFGLTGTPINKRDHNTFLTFGAEEDNKFYLDRYSFEASIRDRATLELHFEPRLVELHIDQDAIDNEIAELTDDLTEDDKAELSRRAGVMGTIVRNPERINTITKDIISHFRANVEPQGFKAMVVCYDRKCCVDYKHAFDQLVPSEMTEIVMTVAHGDPQEWKEKWSRKKDQEEKLLDQYRDPNDPLKIIIVTAKLLTGFDAPILQTMYMDKVLKNHGLLQAVCRINRPYPNKNYGLVVDYIGIFDSIAKTLNFDEKNIRKAITNYNEFKNQITVAMKKCLDYFGTVDRSLSGYEGLIAAQDCLPNNEIRDQFAAEYSYLSKLWEAISPDPILLPFVTDYKWLTQVYESIRPPSGNGRLLWHALGPKTLELINQNIHVQTLRDDLEKIVLDADMVKELSKSDTKAHKRVELEIIVRLRRHINKPVFIELGKRLEALKQRYEQGFLNSIQYLKELLNLAKDVLEAERKVDPVDERNKAKAALTELFLETKTATTPIMVEKIVNEIDEIVRIVRFEGWQWTNAGERDVKQALRKTLMKYKLHKEQELYEKAFNYIRQYY